MQKWTLCDLGWCKDMLYYGAGLMINNADFSHGLTPGISLAGSVGHGGATYGFKS